MSSSLFQNAIVAKYYYRAEELVEHQDMLTYLNILATIQSYSPDLSQIAAPELVALEDLATHGQGVAKGLADTRHAHATGQLFLDYLLPAPQIQALRHSHVEISEPHEQTASKSVQVYPNPATNQVTFGD